MSHFLDLHRPGRPLLIPNPWDAGSARILAERGFQALATTSSGFAATVGRLDGNVTRDEALAHAAAIVAATGLPVSADLERGFGADAAEVAETFRLACATGLAGASIEDASGDPDAPVVGIAEAAERVAAAVEGAGPDFVVTARAENYLYGRDDLADTIARLQAYQEAGAHVVYAPGVVDVQDIRAVVEAVDVPVNVLALAAAPPVPVLAELGVARISVGGAFAFAAYGALAAAADELLEHGTYGFWDAAREGRTAAGRAFA